MNFKLPKLRTPVRASFGFTAVGMAARAVSVLTTPIFTRLLVPGEYGLYTLYMSWLGLLTPFVTWNMQGGGLYRGLQKAGKDLPWVEQTLATHEAVLEDTLLLIVDGSGKVVFVRKERL